MDFFWKMFYKIQVIDKVPKIGSRGSDGLS